MEIRDHAARNSGQLGIQPPFGKESQSARQQAEHHAFNHKRPANKPVGCANHFLNGDLLPPGKHAELDRVGDNEHRNNSQSHHHGKRHNVEHPLHLHQFGDHSFIRTDICHTVHRFDFGNGLFGLCRIGERKDKAVAQRIIRGVIAVEDFGILAQIFTIFFQRNIPIFKVDRGDIADPLKLRAKRLGLARCQLLIDKHHDLARLLQIADTQIDVIRQQRHRSGKDQAGDHNEHRCQRHKAVLENIAEAFLPVISEFSHT